ncbi:MAG: hypothetical protein ACQEQH_09120 [Bacillota bacterium]
MSDYQPQKHTDLEYEEILEYLKKVKIAIVQEKYTLSTHRVKNKEFIEAYNLSSKKIENIIFNLEVEDFCYAVDNEKEEFLHEILYVFCSRKELNYFGEYKVIDIYIKFNLIESADYLYVISFHEREKSVSFLFKQDQ